MFVRFALISFVFTFQSTQSKPFKLQLTWNNEVNFLSQTFDVDDVCKDSNKPDVYCPWRIYQLSEQQVQSNSSPVVISLPPNGLNLMSVNQQTTDDKTLSQNVNHIVASIDCLSKFFIKQTKSAFTGWRQKCFVQSLPIKFENYVNLFQFARFFNNEDIMLAAAADISGNIQMHGETLCLAEIQVDSTSDLSLNSTIINACEDLSPKDWFSITCSSTNLRSHIQTCAVSLHSDVARNTFKRIVFFIKMHVLELLRKKYSDTYDRFISQPISSMLIDLIFKQKYNHVKSLLVYRKELNIYNQSMDTGLTIACKISPSIANMMIKTIGNELNIFAHDWYQNNILTLLTQLYHLFDDSSIIDSTVDFILQSYPSASRLIDIPNVDGYTPYMIVQEMNHTRLQNLFNQFRQQHQIPDKISKHTYQTEDHDLSFHENRIQNKKFFEQFAKTTFHDQKDDIDHEDDTVNIKLWPFIYAKSYLIDDQLYLELQRQFNDTFIVLNILIPLAAYTDETALRIELFDNMKALARNKYENYVSFLSANKLTNDDEYHSNAIQLAWKIINAIKLVRKFNYTTQFDCKTNETNQVLSPYLINVPIQYYHGGCGDIKNKLKFSCCMDKRDPNFNSRFRYMYRAIWIHSTKIDLNSLKHPTNFNSWSLELDGAFSVIDFFADQIGRSTVDEFEALGSWPFRYLVILVAEVDWKFAQSVTKWYPNRKVALEEKEVVIPPFCNYEIDSIGMEWDDLQHDEPFLSVEYKRRMRFSMPFFGQPLRSKNIVLYNVTKINCESWDDWFAKIN